MTVEAAHARRKAAGERLLLAWGVAIVPNTLEVFGVNLPDAWWWYLIWFALSALWLVALLMWLAALWRERQARRVVSDTAPCPYPARPYSSGHPAKEFDMAFHATGIGPLRADVQLEDASTAHALLVAFRWDDAEPDRIDSYLMKLGSGPPGQLHWVAPEQVLAIALG